MRPEEVHSLLEAYHDGTLTDADAAQLATAIEAGDETSRLIMDEMQFSGLLSTALEDFDGEGFVRSLQEKFRAQEGAGVFTEKFQERVKAANIGKPEAVGRKTMIKGNLAGTRKSLTQQYLRESSHANWGFRIVAALAASLVVAAGGYWLFNNAEKPGRYVPAVSALAAVQTMDGKVEMTRGVQRFPVTVGMQVCDGDTLSVSAGSRADVRYAGEQTTIALHPGTTAKLWMQNEAKRISLDAGTLVCQIAKQPEDKPMRFITPHAEAVVLGTQLRLAVTNNTTQLEVIEGSVRLVRNDQKFVVVNSGQSAVAAEGVDLKAEVVKTASPVAAQAAQAKGQVAGAASYYARWPNGIPADPNFFPIWVWDQDPANVNDYKDAGMNMYVGPCGITESDLAKLTAAGMKLICEQDDYTLKLAATSKTIVGWINYDLPDIAQMDGENVLKIAMKSSWISDRYNAYKSKDPSRPVYLALSQGVVRDDYPARRERVNHPEDYREFVKGADLFGLHVMPFNEPQPPVRNSPWYVATATDKLLALSGGAKPVWCAIECTKTSEKSPAKPTPAQVKAEVWMGLVHGADGIGYLCYSRVQSFKRAALLKDKVMLATIAGINRQITSLAPVLNSATVPDSATVNSSNTAVPVDLMVKKYAGATYIFAVAMRDGSTTATFATPSGVSAEVLGENRSLAISDGKFSDQFESYGVHLYKVSGTIDTASKQ